MTSEFIFTFKIPLIMILIPSSIGNSGTERGSWTLCEAKGNPSAAWICCVRSSNLEIGVQKSSGRKGMIGIKNQMVLANIFFNFWNDFVWIIIMWQLWTWKFIYFLENWNYEGNNEWRASSCQAKTFSWREAEEGYWIWTCQTKEDCSWTWWWFWGNLLIHFLLTGMWSYIIVFYRTRNHIQRITSVKDLQDLGLQWVYRSQTHPGNYLVRGQQLQRYVMKARTVFINRIELHFFTLIKQTRTMFINSHKFLLWYKLSYINSQSSLALQMQLGFQRYCNC